MLVLVKIFGCHGGFAHATFAIDEQQQVSARSEQFIVDALQVIFASEENFRQERRRCEGTGDAALAIVVMGFGSVAKLNISTGSGSACVYIFAVYDGNSAFQLRLKRRSVDPARSHPDTLLDFPQQIQQSCPDLVFSQTRLGITDRALANLFSDVLKTA